MARFFHAEALKHPLHVSTFEQKTFICVACGKSAGRQQELDRHYQSFHLPSWIFCPYPGCQWRGNRVDEFQAHLGQQKCGEQPAQEQEYQIYNVKMVLDWIKSLQGNGVLSTAQNIAVDAVKERALELGEQEWLKNPWGRSHKKAHHD